MSCYRWRMLLLLLLCLLLQLWYTTTCLICTNKHKLILSNSKPFLNSVQLNQPHTHELIAKQLFHRQDRIPHTPVPLGSTTSQIDKDIIKKAMKSSIMWYKDYLSPVLPPRCRFLPSCSTYGIEAIDKFGPWKGGILTAWRILRCNPFGGSGYDPPVWPPPNYYAGSTTKKR